MCRIYICTHFIPPVYREVQCVLVKTDQVRPKPWPDTKSEAGSHPGGPLPPQFLWRGYSKHVCLHKHQMIQKFIRPLKDVDLGKVVPGVHTGQIVSFLPASSLFAAVPCCKQFCQTASSSSCATSSTILVVGFVQTSFSAYLG